MHTLRDLAGLVAERQGISRKDALALLETVFSEIGTQARNGGVSISGFGKFLVTERKARKSRNPRTGEPITVPASKKVVFRPAKPLRDSLA